MPNYEAMYKRLFRSTTDAISILQKAQQDSEEIFISTTETILRVFDAPAATESEDGDGEV